LALLNALRNGERTVGDLAAAVGARQPLVSQHLGVPKMIQACDLLREVLFEHLRAQEQLLATNRD